MSPLRQFMSGLGLLMIFMIAYATFSSFFTQAVVNDKLDLSAPGQIVKWAAPIYSDPQKIVGTIYYIKYPRSSVFYIENINLQANSQLGIYLSNNAAVRGDPLVGPLVSGRGNLTVYISPDIPVDDYEHILFWSDQTQRVVAFANISRNESSGN